MTYFWFVLSAAIFAWCIWFTVHTFRKLPGQAWKREQRRNSGR